MITPNQLTKSGTEHGEQSALFAWCAVAYLHGFDIADAWAKGEIKKLPKFQEVYDEKTLSLPMCYVVPELKWFHAIANGGSRGDDSKSRAIRGAQLKAEGVKVGVSDTFLPVKRGPYSGLYIEMKTATGKPSAEQLEFGEFVQAQGFAFAVCHSWREAADFLIQYLEVI